jgi:thymidylate synthase
METRYVQVEGHPGLIRDLKTNAILNTDTQASSHYTSSKERRLKEKEKFKILENEIMEIKSDLHEIKQLLKGISNGS